MGVVLWLLVGDLLLFALGGWFVLCCFCVGLGAVLFICVFWLDLFWFLMC